MTAPLLPSGFMDLLPPYAMRQHRVMVALIDAFDAAGFALVSPPLLEFEETLSAGNQQEYGQLAFRVLDPDSQRMMAVRADMTMQIARIAGSLLKKEPRPLKLCYGGQVVRSTTSAQQPSRQFRQCGIERFGNAGIEAEREVLSVTLGALQSMGLTGISVDLSGGSVLAAMLKDVPKTKRGDIFEALRHKDASALADCRVEGLGDLCAMAGPAEKVLAGLQAMTLADPVVAIVEQLRALHGDLTKQWPNLPVTIDLLDMQGFGYYSGVGFGLYSIAAGIEIGRGGRYRTEYGEDAVGCTLYADALARQMNDKS